MDRMRPTGICPAGMHMTRIHMAGPDMGMEDRVDMVQARVDMVQPRVDMVQSRVKMCRPGKRTRMPGWS